MCSTSLHPNNILSYLNMLFRVLYKQSNLEYLNLSTCHVSTLSESLGNLKMLRTCIYVIKLPQNILKLPNFEALVVRGCYPHIEEQIKESSLANGLLSLPKIFICTMHGGNYSNIVQLEGVNYVELVIKIPRKCWEFKRSEESQLGMQIKALRIVSILV